MTASTGGGPALSGVGSPPFPLSGLKAIGEVDARTDLVRVPGGAYEPVISLHEHPSGMWVLQTRSGWHTVPGWGAVATMSKHRARDLRAEAVEWAEGH